ncbi:aminoglycoside 6-adenylyltransferase [Neisseria sp. Ec49-e6-T10]|uniref:aminoglycoside 6-adenylyltransferase n=1 Tax=Neisseria sp. Ec49-e6-T10 TaxID=3140744 RepID=UPI003EC02125
MFDLILNLAKQNVLIRAVYMNGSRVNPNIQKDIWQDYDIVYVVHHIAPFVSDQQWLQYFGDLVIMQQPDDPTLFDDVRPLDEQYAFLMQFTDGTRIDLTLQTIEYTKHHFLSDTLTLPLLDKDHILPDIAPPSDKGYWVKKPSSKEFLGTCNEFWWVSTYVAKALARNDVLSALQYLNDPIRAMLIRVLNWFVGIDTCFSVNLGKNAQNLQYYLPNETWQRLLKTYPKATIEAIWQALFETCSLFHTVAQDIAIKLQELYDLEESNRTFLFLQQIKNLHFVSTT